MTDTHPHDVEHPGDYRAGANPTRGSPPERGSPSAASLLDHVVVEHDDAPDACTIYPIDASVETLRTNWLTARGGSFVDLESIR